MISTGWERSIIGNLVKIMMISDCSSAMTGGKANVKTPVPRVAIFVLSQGGQYPRAIVAAGAEFPRARAEGRSDTKSLAKSTFCLFVTR